MIVWLLLAALGYGFRLRFFSLGSSLLRFFLLRPSELLLLGLGVTLLVLLLFGPRLSLRLLRTAGIAAATPTASAAVPPTSVLPFILGPSLLLCLFRRSKTLLPGLLLLLVLIFV